MARQYKAGLIITGDASGGIKAIQTTEKELGQLNKGFERGSRRAQQFARDSNETGRELEFLRNAAVGVGTAVAGAFAVSNLAGQAQMVAETDALAKALGVATGELQAWQYAGEQVGIQGDKMADIFKDVSDKIGDFAATGGGEAADLFEKLNLDVQEMLSLSPDQQLLKIADALGQIEDPSQRTFFLESLADDAVRLQPLLENNAEALREYIEEAERLGVSMDRSDIEAVVQADRAMKQLSATAQGLSNQLLADLGPGISELTGKLTDFIQQAGGAEEVLEGVGQAAAALGAGYLARRLGPKLLSVGTQGLAAGGQIAQGMVIATGATGRLNQALVLTQGRIAATAAAGRALRGALTLIGGPGGAAVLAGYAIYEMADSATNAITPTERLKNETAALRNELYRLSEAEVESQLTQNAIQMAEQYATVFDLRRQLQEQKDAPPSQPDVWYRGANQDAAAVDDARIAALEAQIDQAKDAQGELTDQGQLLKDRLEEIKEAANRTKTALSTNTSATEAAVKAAKEAAEREKQFASSLATLEDRLFPANAAQREFLQSQILLQTGLIKGEIGIDRYLAAWERLNTEHSRKLTGGFMEQVLTGEASDGIKEMDDAAQDLGFTFESAFESAVLGGEGFRNVLQGIAQDIAKITLRKTVSEPLGDAVSGIANGFDWGSLLNFGGSGGGAGNYSGTAGGLYADGGYTGDGSTHEPAGIVHRGEFVVKKSVVEQPGVLPMLERLNRMPGYAAGGYVGSRTVPMASGDVSVHIHNEGGEAIQVDRREERRGGDGRRELHLWVNRAVDQRINQRFADGSLDRTMRNNYGARRQSK
ncbi:hypothetical protein [Halomonas elongata]|uniref:hypothetical protein n=1 Tax=Halomonas elongata TaxID=2746 RepID=UPI00186BA518|nr:hypothetical protein [Halomonas elongata]MBW5802051.1 hypothetical protein [Halomonas elongata]